MMDLLTFMNDFLLFFEKEWQLRAHAAVYID